LSTQTLSKACLTLVARFSHKSISGNIKHANYTHDGHISFKTSVIMYVPQ